MKNELTCKNERKSKIKERLKQKLEYSEKIKDIEYNKKIKRYHNIKNKELPKIKILNHIKNNNIIEGDNNYNQQFNINEKYYGLKSLNNYNYKNYNTELNISDSLNNSQNLKGMNLISFNENINNIYKKITINDFNNKEINKNVYYDIITQNSIKSKSSNKMNNKNGKKIPNKCSNKIIGTYGNVDMILNDLNQNKGEYSIPEAQDFSFKSYENNGRKFNFMKTNNKINIINNQNLDNKKYYTNKASPRKYDTNLKFIEKEQKPINNKIYEEDVYFINKDNLKLKNSLDLKSNENENDYIINKDLKNLDNSSSKNELDERSDVTLVSFVSEDIKDISSDFSNL